MAQNSHSEPLHVDTQLGSHFNVGPRFTELCAIGYGCNGLVFAAKDRDCDKKVAIKKISFHNRESCKYALREVKIMRRLDHENIVSVYDVLGEGGRPLEMGRTQDLRAVYIIQELLDTDLNVLIQRKSLQPQHIQWFLYQLLRGLKYIHSANVLHRDLKPSNLLVNCEDLTLKITDFGLARVLDPVYNHSGHLTENVGTFWYKSPELILSPRSYSKATDVWSAGCILAEMLLGSPLFPGLTDLDQLHNILDSAELTEQDWRYLTQTVSNKLLKNHPLVTVRPLREKMGNVDAQAYSLLSKLLKFRPGHRITAEEALCDPYLQGFCLHSDEPRAAHPLRIEHEVDDLSPTTLKELIVSESIDAPESCGQTVAPAGLVSWDQGKTSTKPLATSSHTREESRLTSEWTANVAGLDKSVDSLPEAAGSDAHSQPATRTPEEIKSLTDSQNELEKLNHINAQKSSSSDSLVAIQTTFQGSQDLSTQTQASSGNILNEHKSSRSIKEGLCIYQDEVDSIKSKKLTSSVITSKDYDKILPLEDKSICDKNLLTSESIGKESWPLEGHPEKWNKIAKESFKVQDCDFSEKDEAEISPRKLEEDMLMAQQDSDIEEKLEIIEGYNRIECDKGGDSVMGDENSGDVSEDVKELNKKNRCVDLLVAKDCDIFSEKDSDSDQSFVKELHLCHFSEIENYKEYFSPSPKSVTPSTDEESSSKDMETRWSSTEGLLQTDEDHPGTSGGSSSCGWVSGVPASSTRGIIPGPLQGPSLPLADKNARDMLQMQPSPSSDSSDCDNVWWEKRQEKELSGRLNQFNVHDDEESLIDNEAASCGRLPGNQHYNVKKHKTQVNLQSHAPSRYDWDKNRQPPYPAEEDGVWGVEQEYRLPSAHLPRDRHRTNQRLKELRHRYNEDRHLAEIALHERINERLKLEDKGLVDEACGGAECRAGGSGSAFHDWLRSDWPESLPPQSHHSSDDRNDPYHPPLPDPSVARDLGSSGTPSYGAKPKGFKHVSKSSK